MESSPSSWWRLQKAKPFFFFGVTCGDKLRLRMVYMVAGSGVRGAIPRSHAGVLMCVQPRAISGTEKELAQRSELIKVRVLKGWGRSDI